MKDKNKHLSVSGKEQRTVEQVAVEESLWTIALEVFLPFIVAGLGMSTTGITLHYVKVRCF